MPILEKYIDENGEEKEREVACLPPCNASAYWAKEAAILQAQGKTQEEIVEILKNRMENESSKSDLEQQEQDRIQRQLQEMADRHKAASGSADDSEASTGSGNEEEQAPEEQQGPTIEELHYRYAQAILRNKAGKTEGFSTDDLFDMVCFVTEPVLSFDLWRDRRFPKV